MKNINTKKYQKKKIIITFIFVISILSIITCYVFVYHGSLFGWQPYPRASSNSPTDEQINNGTHIKSQSIDNQQTKPGASGSDQPPAPITQPDGKSLVEVSITATNQTTSSLQIRSVMSTLDTNGTCTLTLQPESGTTVRKNVGIQALSNTSTCKGFDVPTSELPAGKWQITVEYETSNLIGSATKTITIE